MHQSVVAQPANADELVHYLHKAWYPHQTIHHQNDLHYPQNRNPQNDLEVFQNHHCLENPDTPNAKTLRFGNAAQSYIGHNANLTIFQKREEQPRVEAVALGGRTAVLVVLVPNGIAIDVENSLHWDECFEMGEQDCLVAYESALVELRMAWHVHC